MVGFAFQNLDQPNTSQIICYASDNQRFRGYLTSLPPHLGPVRLAGGWWLVLI
jgi:hypothetical protein